jgi:predicted porin
MLGGAYDAGFAKVYASYGQARAQVADFATNTGSIGVSVPAGAGSVLAAIAHTKLSGSSTGDRTTASLGYDYFLSKRTDLYLVAMRDMVTAETSGNSIGAGIRHRF